MKWIELSIICERVATDEVTTLFSDYADNGIIEEDIEDTPEHVKITLYGPEGMSGEDFTAIVTERLNAAKINVIDMVTNEVDDSTWLNSWQQYIEPTEILPYIIINPTWQDYDAKPDDQIIEIDSELSFGTGAHETTRSCAKLLAKYSEGKEHKECLDIGTGTGILLLVAAKLGFHTLTGIDIDESAAKQAQINCDNNRVQATIIHGDLDVDYHGVADVVLANLTVDPLKMLLPVIDRKITDTGILIISGIIDDRYDEIMPYITEHWSIVEEVVEGPWHTFALQKI